MSDRRNLYRTAQTDVEDATAKPSVSRGIAIAAQEFRSIIRKYSHEVDPGPKPTIARNGHSNETRFQLSSNNNYGIFGYIRKVFKYITHAAIDLSICLLKCKEKASRFSAGMNPTNATQPKATLSPASYHGTSQPRKVSIGRLGAAPRRNGRFRAHPRGTNRSGNTWLGFGLRPRRTLNSAGIRR